jgi:hypothetical protein
MTTNGCTTCQPSDLVSLERTRFFSRQLVGPDDLTQDQLYFREKARRHNRLLHGWGIVCGARVRQGEGDCGVVVEPGYVLGPYGDEILIDQEVAVDLCAVDLDGNAVSPCGAPADPWCAEVRVDRSPSDTLYLAVRYAECDARPVQVFGNGCGCDDTDCQYSRTRDSYAIKVLSTLPPTYQTPMLQPDPSIALQCAAGAAPCGALCSDCATDPWVILADVKVGTDGSGPTIDCATHRRYAASYAQYYYVCQPAKAVSVLPGDALRKLLRRPVLVDLTAGLGAEQPGASIPVKRPDGSWVTLPAFFDVTKGETIAQLISKEGDREFLDPSTNERMTLSDLYALAGVDPKTKLSSVDDALAPLEGVQLRVGDLRVVRGGLEDLLDDRGLAGLETAHAGAPGAAAELPASDVKGLSEDSPLAENLAGLKIADAASMTEEEFLAEALKGLSATKAKAATAEAAAVWSSASRIAKLSESWGAG